MDSFIDFLIQAGPIGMFIAAFLAGSFFPFSSETVMVTMLAMGVEPWELVINASIGNTLGSMVNFYIGWQGKEEWFEKYLHVKPKQMERAQRFVNNRGAYMGFFAFIPILGTAICLVLGVMKANPWVALTSIAVGKVLRYVLLLYGAYLVEWIAKLFA